MFGDLLRVILIEVVVELDGFVLLMLVPPLLGVQHPEPQLHDAAVRADALLPVGHVQPHAAVLGEKLVVQQLLDGGTLQLVEPRAPLDYVPQLGVVNLVEAGWLDALGEGRCSRSDER